MLLVVERGIRRGMCPYIYWYANANNKYMRDYDKNKESSCIQCFDGNNLCGWEMSQTFSVNNFDWIKDTS